MNKKNIKVALVIGHSEDSQGAMNKKYNMTEFKFNEKLVDDIFNEIQEHYTNIIPIKVYRESYNELPNQINSLETDFILSFHCNAFDKKTSGFECLYYHTSKKSLEMCEVIKYNFNLYVNEYDGNKYDDLIPIRGPKPKTSEDRGGYLLKNTNAPCVIIESFFIDNDNDLYFFQNEKNYNNLVDSYVKSIEDICKYLFPSYTILYNQKEEENKNVDCTNFIKEILNKLYRLKNDWISDIDAITMQLEEEIGKDNNNE